MPPLNREVAVLLVEDCDNEHRQSRSQHSSYPSSSTNNTHNLDDHQRHHPCPSPANSCISLDDLERFKVDRTENSNDRTKQVSFKDDEELQQIQLVESSVEWSEEEYSSRWHSQDEYATFRRELFHTIYLLRNCPESLDDISYTARGVECRDPAVVGRRQHVKQLAWQSVFDEQETRRKDTCGNVPGQDEWMASLYRNAARPALREALDLAAMDEIEARDVHSSVKNNDATTYDPFSDDWISSISTHSGNGDLLSTDSNTDNEEECGFCVFGAASGFDDDWIHGD